MRCFPFSAIGLDAPNIASGKWSERAVAKNPDLAIRKESFTPRAVLKGVASATSARGGLSTSRGANVCGSTSAL